MIKKRREGKLTVGRGGQIKLSFGMIFSIIIIAATIAVAFYAISYFLDFRECSDIGLFYQDVQNRINDAWRGSITKETFEVRVGGKVEAVCFGNLNSGILTGSDEQKQTILRDKGALTGHNLFIYPSSSNCLELNSYSLEHAEMENFFCADVENGKASIRLEKELQDSLVRLSKD